MLLIAKRRGLLGLRVKVSLDRHEKYATARRFGVIGDPVTVLMFRCFAINGVDDT